MAVLRVPPAPLPEFSIRKYNHRFLKPHAEVCFFAKDRAHVSKQEIFTVPFCSRKFGVANVLLTVHNSTISDHWLRHDVQGCTAEVELVRDAMQRAILLQLPMIVVLNVWCDLASRDTEYDVHYVSLDVARAKMSI